MKIKKHIIVDVSADRAWKVFAHDFDRAGDWIASVPQSYGADIGEKFKEAQSSGRICALDSNPDGMKASESFLAYDEKNKSCTVDVNLVNAPSFLPIRGHVVESLFIADGPNRSKVTFTARPKLKLLGYLLYPMLKYGLGMSFSQVMEEFKHFVETGVPHARKLKAIQKLESESKISQE